MATAPLKYFWTAVYNDGTKYVQPKDDKSTKHEYDAETDFQPSAFRDIEQDKLKAFFLEGNGHSYGVDLETGLFSVDGVEFMVHKQDFLNKDDLRLIHFRETRKDYIDGVAQEPYVNRYFIGWQANDSSGENHQYTIAVA